MLALLLKKGKFHGIGSALNAITKSLMDQVEPENVREYLELRREARWF